MYEQLNLFEYGGCISCDNVGYFPYRGFQEGIPKELGYLMYDCPSCKSTLSKRAILSDIGIDSEL